jgi:hypothetical protein
MIPSEISIHGSALVWSEPVPAKVFQTLAVGSRQDSSTPLTLSFTVAPCVGHVLARSYSTSSKDAEADVAGGRYGRFFRVLFVHSSLRPIVCGSSDGSDREEHMIVPQATYSFDPDPEAPDRIVFEVKRKFLPPSKNHGDLHFRLVVTLRVPIPDAPDGVPPLISAPFKVFSKQSEERDRPPPKRVRNAPPTKPVIALMDTEDLKTLGCLASDDAEKRSSSSSSIAQARAQRICVAVLKRGRDEDDEDTSSSGTLSEHDIEELANASSSSSDDEEAAVVPPAAKRSCLLDASPIVVRPVEIAPFAAWGVPVLDPVGTSILSSRRRRLLSVGSNCSELNLAPPASRGCKDDSFGSLFDSDTGVMGGNFPDLSGIV